MKQLVGLFRTSESHAVLAVVGMVLAVKFGLLTAEDVKPIIIALGSYAVMRVTGKTAKAVMPDKEGK